MNRSNYAADFGGANGASINIVSKSGTNDIHGSLFGFFRNDALDARDPFAFSQALQPGADFRSDRCLIRWARRLRIPCSAINSAAL